MGSEGEKRSEEPANPVFSPDTSSSSTNTSAMWVTHGEGKGAELRDAPSSRKTPKASGATGHTPASAGNRGAAADLRGGVTGPGASPGRGQRPPSLRTLSLRTGVGQRARRVARAGGQAGAGNTGRGSPRPPPLAAPGGVLGVCPTWAVAGAGVSGRGLRAGTRSGQPSAGGNAAAYPSPAADCGGTERGFEGRPSG